MKEFKLDTAIVFCIFNRLETTKKVFEVIRMAKPPRLYLIADAARDNIPGERDKVDAVREYVETHIDWECEVHKNYAQKNMGCGQRIPDGINWVFETEEQAIILEDDCVPEISFFQYCQELLEYYKNDDRIMLISGNNPYAHDSQNTKDYLFSKIPFIWGWATWKRAWKLYDYDMQTFPKYRKSAIFKKVFPLKAYWVYMAEFETVYKHQFDAWDYQMLYATIINEKFCIVPTSNHVTNVGICEESTHTSERPAWMTYQTTPVKYPIQYRDNVEWDRSFDEDYFRIANKHGVVVRIKQLLGMDINKSVFGS